MRFLLLLLASASTFSCSNKPSAEPEMTLESQHSNIPWNRPQAGEGEGFLGGFR